MSFLYTTMYVKKNQFFILLSNYILSKTKNSPEGCYNSGADDRTRTGSLLITSQLLCQLSYVSK